MAHYIDKDVLVAEIERRFRNVNLNYVNAGSHPSALDTNKKLQEGISKNLQSILSFINTLEVKEVDLEKFTEKINTFQGRYKYPEITSIKGAMAYMARMFYSYPNVAREWYESLPKATMD